MFFKKNINPNKNSDEIKTDDLIKEFNKNYPKKKIFFNSIIELLFASITFFMSLIVGILPEQSVKIEPFWETFSSNFKETFFKNTCSLIFFISFLSIIIIYYLYKFFLQKKDPILRDFYTFINKSTDNTNEEFNKAFREKQCFLNSNMVDHDFLENLIKSYYLEKDINTFLNYLFTDIKKLSTNPANINDKFRIAFFKFDENTNSYSIKYKKENSIFPFDKDEIFYLEESSLISDFVSAKKDKRCYKYIESSIDWKNNFKTFSNNSKGYKSVYLIKIYNKGSLHCDIISIDSISENDFNSKHNELFEFISKIIYSIT